MSRTKGAPISAEVKNFKDILPVEGDLRDMGLANRRHAASGK
jgi:hypothetical protein